MRLINETGAVQTAITAAPVPHESKSSNANDEAPKERFAALLAKIDGTAKKHTRKIFTGGDDNSRRNWSRWVDGSYLPGTWTDLLPVLAKVLEAVPKEEHPALPTLAEIEAAFDEARNYPPLGAATKTETTTAKDQSQRLPGEGVARRSQSNRFLMQTRKMP